MAHDGAASPPQRLVEEIQVDLIDPGPNHRSDPAKADIESLSASIRRMGGVINPIRLVRNNGRFTIVAGERRWRASVMAGRQTIAAFVTGDIGDLEAQQLAIHENTQREALSPIDEARAFSRFVENGVTPEALAEEIGRSRSHVYARLRLLELPIEVQLGIHAGKIVASVIEAALDGVPDAMRGTCASAIAASIEAGHELNRKDARRLVTAILNERGLKKKRVVRGRELTPSRRRRMNDETMICHAVRDFGTAIAITKTGKAGTVPLPALGALAEALCKTSPRAREALAEWDIHGRVTRQDLEEKLHPGQLVGLAVHVALLTVVADAKDPVLEELAADLQLDLGRIREDAIKQVREELGEQTE